MPTITQEQDKKLSEDAMQIASLVAATNTDHRHLLYERVSGILRMGAQGYSARLFEWIAAKDRNG